MTPSKKLLSAILGEEVINVDIIDKVIYYQYYKDELIASHINIHELAFKNLKEWASSLGYDLVCKTKYALNKTKYYECNIEKLDKGTYNFYFEEETTSDESSIEAIFKAGEWILKELNKKDVAHCLECNELREVNDELICKRCFDELKGTT